MLADGLTLKLQEISCQQRRETRIPYTFRIRYPEGSRFATFAYPVTRKIARRQICIERERDTKKIMKIEKINKKFVKFKKKIQKKNGTATFNVYEI